MKTPSSPPTHAKSRHGFTLVEILVAVTILAFMTGILASISGQVSNLWVRNEGQSQIRERARTVLDFMADDLRQATFRLSVDSAAPASSRGPNMLMNPPSGDTPETGFNFPNSLFWYAPVATDTTSGDLTLVGYFLRFNSTNQTYDLCRLAIDPGAGDYDLNASLDTLISPTLLNSHAPGTSAEHYRGLLFQNVLGMWITAYDSNGTPYTIDTSTSTTPPSKIEISIVFIDDQTAIRSKAGNATLPSISGTSQDFFETLPSPFKEVAQIATTSVTFKDR